MIFYSKNASIGQCAKQTSTTQVHQKCPFFLFFRKNSKVNANLDRTS